MIAVVHDPRRSLTVFTVDDEIDGDAIVTAVEAEYSKHAVMNSVWDLRTARANRISSATIRRIAEFAATLEPPGACGRTAVVVSCDVQYVMGLMAMFFCRENRAPFEIRIFRKFEDAFHWLGTATPRPGPSSSGRRRLD